MLECYKNDDQLIYTFNCDNFTNQYIKDVKGDVFKFCYAVMHFLNHLKENTDSYKDEGCKYLFYWLHVEVLEKKYPIEHTLML